MAKKNPVLRYPDPVNNGCFLWGLNHDQDRFLRAVYDRTTLAPKLLAAAKLDSKSPAIWRAIQAAYVATIYNLIGETSP